MTDNQQGPAQVDFLCEAGRSTPEMVGDVGGSRLFECRTCGLAFVWPMPSRQELERAVYDEGYNVFRSRRGRASAWKRWRARRAVSLWLERMLRGERFHRRARQLSRLMPKTQACVLDVGCGGGVLLRAIEDARPDWKATGVEPHGPSAAEARQRCRGRIVAGYLSEARLAQGAFDLVCVWNVLEHVPEPRAFVRELARVTRPGGVVVFHTPNFDCVLRRVLGSRWGPAREEGHLWLFRHATLRALLADTGLALESPHAWSPARWLANDLMFVARRAADA